MANKYDKILGEYREADSVDLSGYALLDGSNQPFTGNLNISRSSPEYRLTDTGNSEYSRWTRDSSNNLRAYSRAVSAGSAWGLEFDSTSDKLAASTAVLTGTGDFTITAWIKPSAVATNDIAGNYGTGAGLTGIEFYTSSVGNELKVYMGSAISSGVSISTGVWSFVAVKRSGTTVSFYVNGVAYSGGTSSHNITGSLNWTVGNGPNYTSERFQGVIDQHSVWNTALSTAELNAIYNAGAGSLITPTANTLLLWEMTEGSGTTVADTSGNGLTGTITAAAWVEGKVTSAGTIGEVEYLKVENASLLLSSARITLGATATDNIYNGLRHVFQIQGTEKMLLDSSGNLTASGNISAVGKIYAANGAVATPSISFTSDTDTGFYADGSGGIALGTSGVIRLQATSTGNFIFNTGGFNFLSLNSTSVGVGGLYNTSSSTVGFQNTGGSTTRVTEVIKAVTSQTANLTDWQNSSGTVLSSVDSAGRHLIPLGSTSLAGLAFLGDPNTGLFSNGADNLTLLAGANQRVVVTTTGVGISQTPSFGLDVSPSARFLSYVGIGTAPVSTSFLSVLSDNARTAGSFSQPSAGTAITTPFPAFELINTDATVGNFATFSFADAVGGASYALIGGKCTDHTNNYGELHFWTRGANTAAVRMTLGDASGASATSNFVNHTNTFPATLSAETTGALFDYTTAGSSSQSIRAVKAILSAGYTGSSQTAVFRSENNVAGTGSAITTGGTTANMGLSSNALATTTGLNIGTHGFASGGNANIGMIGLAPTGKNSSANIGVFGYAYNTGTGTVTQTGGFFRIGNGAVSLNANFASAALIADNTDTTDPIFLARDNGSTVFSVIDGGTVNANDIYPNTDNTYYLGKNDDDSPKAWKGIIMKDQSTGTYYRLEISGGTILLTDLTD